MSKFSGLVQLCLTYKFLQKYFAPDCRFRPQEKENYYFSIELIRRELAPLLIKCSASNSNPGILKGS